MHIYSTDERSGRRIRIEIVADEQVETEYSTANENHGSIRDNVDVFHTSVLLLLP